jgi:4-oxalomesaconate tautomerase
MKKTIIKNHRTIIFSIVLLLITACKTVQTPPSVSTAQKAVVQPSNAVECLFMRAGTSRGPFLDLRDLPRDVAKRNAILLKIMGSPDPRQISGLGGATTVTSKVVMVEPSKRKGIDVDYLFAQVDIEKALVDTTPPCGNMMAGVGPFAIEKGWVKTTIPETRVMVYNINTNSIIEEVVQTPKGVVEYDGNTKIDGVEGTAAPVVMNLFDQVGGKTGKLMPTDKIKENINGIDVTLLDAGMPMVLMKASDLGMEGTEGADFFVKSKDLMKKIEQIRLEAGKRMGMGDVTNSVLPKVGILSKPRKEGANITSRYLTPHALHPAHAVTGAICIGTAVKLKGSVAADVGVSNGNPNEMIVIEHPSGVIEVNIEMEMKEGKANVKKVGTVRTVRKIMAGVVFH